MHTEGSVRIETATALKSSRNVSVVKRRPSQASLAIAEPQPSSGLAARRENRVAVKSKAALGLLRNPDQTPRLAGEHSARVGCMRRQPVAACTLRHFWKRNGGQNGSSCPDVRSSREFTVLPVDGSSPQIRAIALKHPGLEMSNC